MIFTKDQIQELNQDSELQCVRRYMTKYSDYQDLPEPTKENMYYMMIKINELVKEINILKQI